MTFGRGRLSRRIGVGAGIAGLSYLGMSGPVGAADTGNAVAIEEVVVTAQRREQGVQEVPIAVTALSGQMLEDRQIVQPSDLQMNSPNVSFTATNFGSSSLSIRGIGRLVTAASGEPGVSIHMNDIAVPTNLPAAEFYDMERIEILRGPQGTLFGRNATGGVLNMITKKPDFEDMGGFVDVEVGDYSHRRAKAAFNLPVTDRIAFRVAGMLVQRDGFTENLAADQGVPFVDDDIDGRDLHSYRVTGQWDMSDRASVWAMYSRFDEDDDKARITNQVCEKSELPTTGCEPDGFGFEGVNTGSTTGGLFAAFAGALPLGASTEAQGLNYPFEPPEGELGLRTMHSDFEPVYEFQEDVWAGGFDYQFDRFTISLLGAHRDSEFLSRQDYNMDVGPSLQPIFGGAVTEYPTSDVRGGLNDPDCNLQDGTFGAIGGCVYSQAPLDRVFSYDQADSQSRYYTAEVKLTTTLNGPFNFLLGGNVAHSESSGNYFVVANSLDIVTDYGSPELGFPPLYPGVFDSHSSGPGYEFDGYSIFGEVYFDVTPAIKLTAGLRYNEDDKKVNDAGYLYNSLDVNAAIGGGLGPDPVYARAALADYVFGGPPALDAAQSELLAFYGALESAQAAASFPEFLAAAQQVPLAPTPGESRVLTNSPSEDTFEAVTGRIGVDWQLSNDSMVYAFFTRGYKPGGFNPPVNPDFQADTPFTFDGETIDSFEIGTKNTLLEGRMMLNATGFYYDYSDLQIAKIQNNTAVNTNVDAEIMGAELELAWQPQAIPRLSFDAAYSWLDTEIASGTELLDPVARTQGDPDLILLKNIDPGSNTGINFVAPRDEALALGPDAVAAGAAIGADRAPAAQYPNGTPVYYSRQFLLANGVDANDGKLADVGGNQLPNAPEHTIHLGTAYTWPLRLGSLTARWDYYWQADSYAREFNRSGDEISSWDQHNASLIFESTDGRWVAKGWIRNIQDDNNVTGHYLTSDTSGLFRNYFLTEPRLYGASLRFAF